MSYMFLPIRFRSELMKAYAQDVSECVLRAVNHGYARAEFVQVF
jgi:hypothetical protein